MRRFRKSTFVSSFLLAAGLIFSGGLAAQGAQAATGGYVALGDSYSSGTGAGSYIDDGCKRSSKAYPYLWNAAHAPSSFAFDACSGAVTTDVTSSQLSHLSSSTGLVSITIGGNDAGFADVMTTCVLSTDSGCLSRIDTARSYVSNTLPARLDVVYTAIRNKAPSAKVVVLGYPRFYEIDTICVGLSDTKRSAINSASDLLNSVISQRASAHGFTFGDVRPAFTGHEICSGSSWLNSLNVSEIGGSYHPTAAGHSGGYLPTLNAND